MRKVILWFLTAQKFIFGFAALFGSIPLTYAFSDTLFDNSFFIILGGLVLYLLSVIPLTYAIVLGYDSLLLKLQKPVSDLKRVKVSTDETSGIDLNVTEVSSSDKGIEEFTIREIEKT